jgi:hypothetical protein
VVASTAQTARSRRSMLWRTLGRLGDDELRARVENSFEDGERTIEEWHEFVEHLESALVEMRRARRSRCA